MSLKRIKRKGPATGSGVIRIKPKGKSRRRKRKIVISSEEAGRIGAENAKRSERDRLVREAWTLGSRCAGQEIRKSMGQLNDVDIELHSQDTAKFNRILKKIAQLNEELGEVNEQFPIL